MQLGCCSEDHTLSTGALCMCSVEIRHMDPMHAAVGSIKPRSAFYLTRDALFSYFSILRAETVTPLSGEPKWDCLLWYNAHVSPSQLHAGTLFPPICSACFKSQITGPEPTDRLNQPLPWPITVDSRVSTSGMCSSSRYHHAHAPGLCKTIVVSLTWLNQGWTFTWHTREVCVTMK